MSDRSITARGCRALQGPEKRNEEEPALRCQLTGREEDPGGPDLPDPGPWKGGNGPAHRAGHGGAHVVVGEPWSHGTSVHLQTVLFPTCKSSGKWIYLCIHFLLEKVRSVT